jgi:RimJ/RimL family protein N-acetyltransferase/catechol 2,3-dioxygenase-like lactoylglutathione lyase family enzyme
MRVGGPVVFPRDPRPAWLPLALDVDGGRVPRVLAPVLPAGTWARLPQPAMDAGEGLALRPFTETDAAAVASAFDDPSIHHWHHRSMSRDEAHAWIAGSHERWTSEQDAEFAVTDAGGLVGRVALRGVLLDIGQAELSYWTLPHARGRGLATRAVARLATWALDEVGFWRLAIRHSTQNPASCRVATAAGFLAEATLRRQHLHADGWHDVHVHVRFRRGVDPVRRGAASLAGRDASDVDGRLRVELFVADVARSVSFYRDVLGFEVDDGAPDERTHVAVRRGAAVVGLQDAAQLPTDPPRAGVGVPPGRGVELVVEVADVAAAHRHAVASGAELASGLERRPGGVDLRLLDPDGHHVRVTSRGPEGRRAAVAEPGRRA